MLLRKLFYKRPLPRAVRLEPVPPSKAPERALQIALASVLSIPAFVFGGNVAWVENGSAIVFCLIAGGLFLLSDQRVKLDKPAAATVLALTTYLVLWPLVQVIPGTALGPVRKIWAATEGLDIGALPYSASLAPDETWRAFSLAAATWAAFWIGVLAFARRSRQIVLWTTLLAFMLANCAYGLGIYASGRNEVLGVKLDEWILKATGGGLVTGTFFNRVHFAIYCVIGLVLTTILATRAAATPLTTRRQVAKALVERWPLLLLVPAGLVLLASIFLSLSRGGMLLAVAVTLAALALRIKSSRTKIALLIVLGLTIAVLFQASLLTDYSRDRLTSIVSSGSDRLSVQMQTARAIGATLGLGVGGGAFEAVFPLYRVQATPTTEIWNAAHGSYVEWPFTYGIMWSLALLATVAVIGRTIVARGSVTGSSNVTVIGLLGVAVFAHAIYDFGLQTLGLTLIISVLAGSSFGRAIGETQRRSSSRSKTKPAQKVTA